MHDFILAFIPLFVAVDAVGSLPVLLGLIQNVDQQRRRRVVIQSMFTALSVAAIFVLAGRPLLRLLGVTASDFMIAGGTLLFVLSLNDLLAPGKARHKVDIDTLGAVPIGVPLITGPAVLTTCMLLVDQYGMAPTLLAAVVNVLLAGAIFLGATPIARLLGGPGTKVISKIANLLLAAIGVMLIRKGLLTVIQQFHG